MSGERLVHYSRKPLGALYSVAQPPADFKPIGLWVSVDSCADNWRAWCETESFNLECLACATLIELAPAANILRIADAAGIDAFTSAYVDRGTLLSHFEIDWRRIAKRYDGIIISPYIWSRHLKAKWYYTWDCASGCIWNADAIASARPWRRAARSAHG